MTIPITNLIRFAEALRQTALQCGRAEYRFNDGLTVLITAQDHHLTLVLERPDNHVAPELCEVFAAAFGVPESSEPARSCPQVAHPVSNRKRTVYRTQYHWREIFAGEVRTRSAAPC